MLNEKDLKTEPEGIKTYEGDIQVVYRNMMGL